MNNFKNIFLNQRCTQMLSSNAGDILKLYIYIWTEKEIERQTDRQTEREREEGIDE